jgi:hypothetical protein
MSEPREMVAPEDWPYEPTSYPVVRERICREHWLAIEVIGTAHLFDFTDDADWNTYQRCCEITSLADELWVLQDEVGKFIRERVRGA